MLKIVDKGEETISCDAMYQFYSNSVFLFYWRLSRVQYGKIKKINFKIAGNWQVLIFKKDILGMF